LQKEGLNNHLCTVLKDFIPSKEHKSGNLKKSFKYGYNEDYDLIVISKDGTIGDVVKINNLNIGLPKKPKSIHKRSYLKKEQYWEPFDYPKALKPLQTIFQWNEMNKEFKETWVPYIEEEFERRENGFWFSNNGIDT
jgi:hypothetical protein